MITALVQVADVDDVGRYLHEHVVPKLDASKAARFSAVADALIALGNDTDAVITSQQVQVAVSKIRGEAGA